MLPLEKEALRAVEVVLAHWDQEYFAPAKEPLFVPRFPSRSSTEKSSIFDDSISEASISVTTPEQNINTPPVSLGEAVSRLRELFESVPLHSKEDNPRAGMGGLGWWKYQTRHKGTNQLQNTVQFQTIWSTPTPKSPIPRATAAVWFIYEKLNDVAVAEMTSNEDIRGSEVRRLSQSIKNGATPVAKLSYRYEHSNSVYSILVPHDVYQIPFALPKALRHHVQSRAGVPDAGTRLSSPSLRIPEIITSCLTISKDMENGVLLGGLRKQVVEKVAKSPTLQNPNGVPLDVITELARTENYPHMTASTVLTRAHLKSDNIAQIPEDDESRISEIIARLAYEEKQRLRIVNERKAERAIKISQRKIESEKLEKTLDVKTLDYSPASLRVSQVRSRQRSQKRLESKSVDVFQDDQILDVMEPDSEEVGQEENLLNQSGDMLGLADVEKYADDTAKNSTILEIEKLVAGTQDVELGDFTEPEHNDVADEFEDVIAMLQKAAAEDDFDDDEFAHEAEADAEEAPPEEIGMIEPELTEEEITQRELEAHNAFLASQAVPESRIDMEKLRDAMQAETEESQ